MNATAACGSRREASMRGHASVRRAEIRGLAMRRVRIVEQAAETITAPQAIKRNRLIGQRRFAYRRWLRERWALAERAVRPVRVVVRRVDLDDALELAAAEDQQPVEALAAQSADPALGVRSRPRCLHRRFDDTDAFEAEHLIEVARELAVAVADQEARPHPFVVESHQQVARLLGHPGAVGVSGDARDVHATARQLNEEQDIETLEEDGVDGEEVALEDARRLPAQKLRPARFETPRRRLDPLAPEDLPDGAGSERDAEPEKLTLDAPIPPARVLAGQPHHQLAHVDRRPGTAGTAVRIRPAPRH